MGQANARGTRQERADQAIERERIAAGLEAEKRAVEAAMRRVALDALPEAERLAEIDRARAERVKRMKAQLLLASALGMTMSDAPAISSEARSIVRAATLLRR